MRYIFDFDDVLFYTTKHRKEYMFPLLEKAGVSYDALEAYYKKARHEQFSPKKILAYFSLSGDLYQEIMKGCVDFVNTELIETVRKIGKENCIIITYGDEEFQREKIKRSGMEELFSEIIVVPGSKKETVEKICATHKDEQIIFIDDKAKYFEDLDFQKYPNLKTILYTGQSLEPYLQ